jgi:hypothetical protein
MKNMLATKLSYMALIFLLICLTITLIVQYGSPKVATEAEGIKSIGINSTKNGEEQTEQVRTMYGSQENPTLIIDSYLSTNITLGKGKPISMAIDPAGKTLYVVSPSDLDGKVRNLIYVIDSNENKVIDIIKIGDSENDFLRDVVVDPTTGMIYATGEYRLNKGAVTYENDSIYFIEPKTKEYKRISVYSEPEEGKEGDLSQIAADATTKLVYVGSLYPEGGMPGMYVIDPVKTEVMEMIDKWESGISEIIVNSKTDQIVAVAKYDNLFSLLNDSTNEIFKNVTVNDPVAISSDTEGKLLYVATGSGNISIINPISGENTSNFVGMSLQGLSFNPYTKLLYMTSVNKTMQFSSNSSSPASRIIAMNPLTGAANDVYQTHAVLSKILSNPSSGLVYVLGYDDDNNSKLFILKPDKFN